MSGGVDSSVAAVLLKKQGHEVVGVFMRLGESAGEKAAKKVAKKLGIKFLVWDFGREFKKVVKDYFLRELSAGRTPNPCVICNPKIKFGLFLNKALKSGADFIATGHYARAKSGRLFAAKDKIKDQSYFLYGLNQKQLSKTIFPLGDMTKKQVVALAKKRHLPYRAGESFDICFIDDYQGFLKKHLKLKPGKIVDSAGKILGHHQGLALYTIGQRANVGGPGPFYVVAKDSRKNFLVVSNKEKSLYEKELIAGRVNWLGGRAKLPCQCQIKIRYQSLTAAATLKDLNKNQVKVIFKRPQRAITTGQSAVFYGSSGEVLGGGIVLK